MRNEKENIAAIKTFFLISFFCCVFVRTEKCENTQIWIEFPFDFGLMIISACEKYIFNVEEGINVQSFVRNAYNSIVKADLIYRMPY